MRCGTWTRAAALLFAALTAPKARAEWHVVASEAGVEVSQEEVPGRSLPRFRGIGEVDADPDRIVEIIRDVPRQCEWMPDCSESRVVRNEGESELLFYRSTDAPWPISDRDVLLRSELRVLAPGREILITFHAVDDPAVPPRDGHVRMTRCTGSYHITAIAPGSSRVEIEVDADPGGSFPAWLAARTSRDNPIRTIVNLRQRVGL